MGKHNLFTALNAGLQGYMRGVQMRDMLEERKERKRQDEEDRAERKRKEDEDRAQREWQNSWNTFKTMKDVDPNKALELYNSSILGQTLGTLDKIPTDPRANTPTEEIMRAWMTGGYPMERMGEFDTSSWDAFLGSVRQGGMPQQAAPPQAIASAPPMTQRQMPGLPGQSVFGGMTQQIPRFMPGQGSESGSLPMPGNTPYAPAQGGPLPALPNTPGMPQMPNALGSQGTRPPLLSRADRAQLEQRKKTMMDEFQQSMDTALNADARELLRGAFKKEWQSQFGGEPPAYALTYDGKAATAEQKSKSAARTKMVDEIQSMRDKLSQSVSPNTQQYRMDVYALNKAFGYPMTMEELKPFLKPPEPSPEVLQAWQDKATDAQRQAAGAGVVLPANPFGGLNPLSGPSGNPFATVAQENAELRRLKIEEARKKSTGGGTKEPAKVLEKLPSASLLSSRYRPFADMLRVSSVAVARAPREVQNNIVYMFDTDKELLKNKKTPRYFTYDKGGNPTGATQAARRKIDVLNNRYKGKSARPQYITKPGSASGGAGDAKAQYISDLKKAGATPAEIATLVKQKFGG